MTACTSHDTFFIGGEWIAPATDQRLPVISPTTEEVIATVPEGSAIDIDRAVTAARRAMTEGPWHQMPLEERIATLARLRDLIAAHAQELAAIITEEMGCPITQSRALQIPGPLAILDHYLEAAKTYPFREVRQSLNGRALVLREPVGVVAGIVPWNLPLSLMVQKMTPALLAGCSVIIKPAPETPLDAYVVAALSTEAGIPPGVLSVVPADREVSEYLVCHPGVDKVTFTGSTAAGRRIAALCGQDLKPVTLELGGKSAAIVLDDADLDLAVESLRLGAFRNSGQVCTLKTRVVVPASMQGELLDRICGLIDSMPVGDPRDPATQIGPMVSARHRDRVEAYIASGRQAGATLVRGGGRPDIGLGWFVEPTVFGDVDPRSTIAQEEIFGPVLSVIPYTTEAEAIGIANDSPYGLSGAVFSADLEHAAGVASQMQTGVVELNGSPIGSGAPFGGYKASGLGREFGHEGIDPFVKVKSVGLPPSMDLNVVHR